MRIVSCMVVCLLLVLASGCSRGPSPPKRGKLEGKVTLNGKPVASGLIRFMALDPNALNVVAPVKDGQYSIPAEQGPTKGKYRVEFSVPSAAKQRVPNDDVPGTFMEVSPETLPPRYHRDSQITIDYDPDKPQSHDFQLTTP
jgi:hypothetical protein